MSDFGKRLLGTWRRVDAFWFRPVDARVYGLLRVAFATVALLNLVDLWPHRVAFFSDAGMLDLGAAMTEQGARVRLSVFYFAESPATVTMVFLCAGAAMVCLGLGWWPRLMIVIVFVWQLSYTFRAEPVIHGWDVLMRILALVLVFSPLGPSLSEWRQRKSGEAVKNSLPLVPRYGLVLIQIQLAVIYWQTVWLKVVDASWRNGEVLSYFMLSIYSRFPNVSWQNWEVASALLTYTTLAVEIAVPLLLWNRGWRWLGFLAGFGLHLSILAVSPIWLFSLAILIPYLAFLEGDDLDRCSARVVEWRKRGAVLH